MSFAEGTAVSVEKSKLELERLLVKHGAKQYGSAHDEEGGLALVYFKMADRHIRLQIPIPALTEWPDPKKDGWQQDKKTPRGWDKLGIEGRKAWVQGQREQLSRTRWRCMLLIVKAKLEHIALGMSDVEREFLADIALPDGRSVAELLKPALERAYLDGSTPRLLGAGGVVEGELEP